MVRVLMTVLASLSIPAIALGVIAAIERRRQDSHDGMANLPEDASAAPEFEVSAQARTWRPMWLPRNRGIANGQVSHFRHPG